MKRDFSTAVTGWLFVLGALMLWLGWVLMPRHIGTFFKPDDFSAVLSHLHLWIWMFRIHIFGFLILIMALVALASVLTEARARVLAWPGIAVTALGLSVGALAAAFYYHHGAWGAIQTEGLSAEALQRHVDALRVDTEYITCLVRFSRVFIGLGLVVLAAGTLKWRLLPNMLGIFAVILGLAAMTITMAFPDNLEYYGPVFHLNMLWFAATGMVVLLKGVRLMV